MVGWRFCELDRAWLKQELDRGRSRRLADPVTAHFWDALRDHIRSIPPPDDAD